MSQLGQRSKSCLSNNSKTTGANLMKLHRKIEHNEKVCRAQELGSYTQGRGHNHVRGQIVPKIALLINYRIYPKYSDTLNIRTPSFFLKRHLFYVPYISGHVPYRVFLLSVNVRTPKTCPLFLIKLLFFTTRIFCIFALFTCVSG